VHQTFISHIHARVCFNADCDGVNFVGLAEGSEWEVEPTDDGAGLQKRILSCPAGTRLKKSSSYFVP
jgi:hypothetical protein